MVYKVSSIFILSFLLRASTVLFVNKEPSTPTFSSVTLAPMSSPSGFGYFVSAISKLSVSISSPAYRSYLLSVTNSDFPSANITAVPADPVNPVNFSRCGDEPVIN